MKSVVFLLAAMMVASLAGGATAPVAFAPVGPNPFQGKSAAANGQLVVFSCLVGRIEGDSPSWFRHSDYEICDRNGHLWRRGDNSVRYYDQAPRKVSLPAGWYLVKAEAEDYSLVEAPVHIESGRTTRVHLDDNWRPPPSVPKSEIVSAPDGIPVGWRAEVPKSLWN